MCRDVLGIELETDPDRASSMLRSHLNRAKWLSADGRQRILED
jgi:hypothetical protein